MQGKSKPKAAVVGATPSGKSKGGKQEVRDLLLAQHEAFVQSLWRVRWYEFEKDLVHQRELLYSSLVRLHDPTKFFQLYSDSVVFCEDRNYLWGRLMEFCGSGNDNMFVEEYNKIEQVLIGVETSLAHHRTTKDWVHTHLFTHTHTFVCIPCVVVDVMYVWCWVCTLQLVDRRWRRKR